MTSLEDDVLEAMREDLPRFGVQCDALTGTNQSEGEHSPSLSHTRTLALFHKVEGSLTHSKVGYTLTRSLTSQSRTQS